MPSHSSSAVFLSALTKIGNRAFVSLVMAATILTITPALGQDSPKRPVDTTQPKPPTASFDRHGWAKSGELVLAISIAAGSKPLNLGGVKGGKNGGEELIMFSMGSSTLIDLHSGSNLKALQRLPRKPFFGNMEGIIGLRPGESLTFGVAFPRPPPPPMDKEGKRMPYRLKLSIPDIPPLEFEIPFEDTPAPGNKAR